MFSEKTLMKNRVIIETKWLKFQFKENIIKN